MPEGVVAGDLAQRAFELVEQQLRAATTQDGTSWASQPGAIRTFREDGTMSRIYKLYSAPDLLAGSTAEAMADLPDARFEVDVEEDPDVPLLRLIIPGPEAVDMDVLVSRWCESP